MLSHWPIKKKLMLGVIMLGLMLLILAATAINGVYAYRHLARTISYETATELRLASELSLSVGDLRATINRLRRQRPLAGFEPTQSPFETSAFDTRLLHEQFSTHQLSVSQALQSYRDQLDHLEESSPGINDPEYKIVQDIETALAEIKEKYSQNLYFGSVDTAELDGKLAEFQRSASQLPLLTQERMKRYAGEVRGQYRTWIVLSWTTIVLSTALVVSLVFFFRDWVFRPIRSLVQGSRRVAGGDFDFRIQIDTQDEIAELAGAMNDMTDKFLDIKQDLDNKVRERTREVVRSERLASVGFLAAGVSHEINNPLQAIAICAESLESRVAELAENAADAGGAKPDVEILQKYLKRIQDEAFRCKGITEGLLSFSRMGEVKKTPTDLTELIEDVISLVQHVGHYKQKEIVFTQRSPITAAVNPQELKQVVLNLITNALDSLSPHGTVTVSIETKSDHVIIKVSDDGCGMTDEVREHLFEPFFTRRRDGTGTGLGLSITYRIIEDHGGKITAESAGPDKGSQFYVHLPLTKNESKSNANDRKPKHVAA